jgi:hypothetical protein
MQDQTTQPTNITYRPPAKPSSQVESFGYDPETKTLGVKFVRGGTYHYLKVPQETADAMAAAESVGKFVGQALRGKFEFVRLADVAVRAA